jgi:hypothetical protein
MASTLDVTVFRPLLDSSLLWFVHSLLGLFIFPLATRKHFLKKVKNLKHPEEKFAMLSTFGCEVLH